MKNRIKAFVLGVVGCLVCSAATPYIGGSVGYLLDGKDPIYGGKVGVEFVQGNPRGHAVLSIKNR